MSFMSAVGGMAKDAAQSAVGIVGKAQLIFKESKTAAATQAGNQSVVDSARSALMDKGTKFSAWKASKIKDAAGLSSTGSHTMQVQYNPTSLSIQASAQSIPFQMLQDNINSTIPNQQWRDPAVVLTVDLIFDDMNPVDAFMADKFMLLNGGSVGNLVSIGSGIAKAAMGKVYSVQQQTNALVAAAIRDSTRNVTFKWAGMSFSGEITEVNAAYTMFSVSGRPVRSTVRLSITQQVSSVADSDYWDGAFNTAFGAAGQAGASGGRSPANKAGNLINFNF